MCDYTVIIVKFFASEIVVVDIQSLNTYKYGSEFNQRAFLLYDGVHYDAMAEALESQGEKKSEDTDVTVFDSSDESRISAALDVAAELKARNQFVNLAGCDLKCLVCGRGLKGQAGALEHARATSHQNFGQI
uniref:Ubiquitin thioesterase OTU n=1 Tax=Heterosigma akashiwo TaxID=2829 RepID=A0A7S3XT64_HETAK